MSAESAPDVTVVIPTRNRASLLERAVESVRGQTFGAWEMIIVDDGSTDRTPSVVRRYVAEDRRIRSHEGERSVGAAAARNQGVGLARGRYVAFLDDDGIWLPRKLEQQVEAMDRADDRTGAVYCPWVYVDADGGRRVIGAGAPSGSAARRRLLRGSFIDTSSILARRDTLSEVDGFDPAIIRMEDWDLCLRMDRVSRIECVPEPLALVCFTPGSVSTRDEALLVSCRRLASKFSEDTRFTRGELGQVLYVLGHELTTHGFVREGFRMMARSLWRRPWPVWRFGFAALAALGGKPYAYVASLHASLAGRLGRRRALDRAPASDSPVWTVASPDGPSVASPDRGAHSDIGEDE